MISRSLETIIRSRLFTGKTIILLGPRQVGKTTLAESLVSFFPGKTLWLSGDDADVVALLREPSLSRLRAIVNQNTLVIVDEAQRIPQVGTALKLLHDNFKEVQVLATGSSALDLASALNEPLTGRKWEYLMFPLAFEELVKDHGLVAERGLLHQRLVFGAYPEVVENPGQARERLLQLATSYLYRDLFRLEQIKKPILLENIVRALAFQVGNEVSFNEIGQLVGASQQTVEKYIDLLEKAYIIFRLPALSRNVRNEIKKSRKIYFYDNGIRNAVTGNFAQIESRTDVGALWENYLVSERLKYLNYKGLFAKSYFWRTSEQQEIDYIEESDGEFRAFEFKWNPDAKARFSTTFLQNYPIKETAIITPNQYDTFLM